ncbi:DegV family protein [Streptococcus sp. sy018]|uniref:DegV family protein n=1 Tax=Streptococcus sp. sy018 TaxID=2600147 RepID=UPI0011B687C5|nr:DegV family protein [Streptococcus sp. sy018]TWS95373.1 DegV family protein [Streptococcus sp. sy018]
MKLAVITDSSAYLEPKVKQAQNLFCLDIPIIMDKQSYVEGKNLSLDEFYRYLATATDLPTTSQPSLSELVATLDQLVAEGYTHVIGLFLSSGISGFWQNIQYLVEDYDQLTLAFPDTKITSAPLGSLVANTLMWAESGQAFDSILARLEQQIEQTGAFIMVDDLNHLVRGGRLSNGSALLGNLLNIKPILYFTTEGKIEVFDKVRTEKKAQKRLVDILEKQMTDQDYELFILHSNAPDKVEKLQGLLREQGYKIEQIKVVPLNSVISTHVGQGTIALALTPHIL